MNILVVGSGVIGVTTAFCLSQQGHNVTVVDREEGPGRGTSFANAALLTPSMSAPWNAPGCGRELLGSFTHPNSALQLSLRALPSLIGWGVRFLRNSRTTIHACNARSNLQLALYSLNVMEAVRAKTQIDYGRSVKGTLTVFRDAARLDKFVTTAGSLSSEGLAFHVLSASEAVQLEPELEPVSGQLAGAVQFPMDETGDAFRFCEELAAHAQRAGAVFHFCTEVSSLERRSGRIEGVIGGGRRFVADRYVIAGGSYSPSLLRGTGIQLPVQPVKGYSVTFNNANARCRLQIPIIDDRSHTVVTPLNAAIRVVGFAEFAGYSRQLSASRIRHLQKAAQSLLPNVQWDDATARPWCGLRPMSVDGVPFIGPTRIPNLFVNTGHGHLGWTMAAGSAQLLADLMSGHLPSIDPAPYDLKRLA
jgi:D-amino-acid dehydrogenase